MQQISPRRNQLAIFLRKSDTHDARQTTRLELAKQRKLALHGSSSDVASTEHMVTALETVAHLWMVRVFDVR